MAKFLSDIKIIKKGIKRMYEDEYKTESEDVETTGGLDALFGGDVEDATAPSLRK